MPRRRRHHRLEERPARSGDPAHRKLVALDLDLEQSERVTGLPRDYETTTRTYNLPHSRTAAQPLRDWQGQSSTTTILARCSFDWSRYRDRCCG